MTTPMLAVALTLALQAATESGTKAAPLPAASESPALRDWDKPPPGSKADQALWQTAHDLNTQLVIEQHVAARLTQGAKGSGYLERLPELGNAGAMPKARADELAARLRRAWEANLGVVQSRWPVSKVRVCGYELLNFESLMGAGAANENQLADTRGDLSKCVARANAVMLRLGRSNAELQAALADVERELASLPATAPTAAPPDKAKQPAASPSPAATATPEASAVPKAH